MKASRNTWFAALLAVGMLPGLAAAADPANAPAPDVQKRLEDARKRLDAAAREVAELSGQMGRELGARFARGPQGVPRAMLGIGVGYGHKDGAHVLNVSPGGPAEEAGIKAGDVITSISGKDLAKESDPGQALVEHMRQLDPNLKVQVGVLRDGKKLNFDVTPRPAPQVMALGGRGMPPIPALRGPDVQPRPGQVREIVQRTEGGARFRGLEFATLSERLGGYFGVKKGVLVVRAPADSPFKLQDGDVILAIDGREPENAQHAGRILRSYRNGEKLALRVQRDRKAQTIELTVQDGRDD